MSNTMRPSTLQTLDLGTVLDIFNQGRMPVKSQDLVEKVFGTPPENGSLVISGANGIVGAGKTMQLGSRLQPFNIPVIALDFPGVPDGLGRQFPGLKQAFGQQGAHQIMENIISMNYDGTKLPARLKGFNPRFLLEAIPEILEVKKRIEEKVRGKAHKSQKDFFLREQMKAIEDELGLGIDDHAEIAETKSKILKAEMPADIETASANSLARPKTII